MVDTALTTVDKALAQTASLDGPTPRDQIADQILRETLLTVSSDWPFMVSKDSAADYARYRATCMRTRPARSPARWRRAARDRPAARRRLEPCRRAVRCAGCTKAAAMTAIPRHERARPDSDTRLVATFRAPCAEGGHPSESPCGVVGIPAGGGRRAWPARPPLVDRAGRGRP
ncbi:hypothetical protein I552_4703 [Mycobacterium xenopi 3993]|nr:hypothetical protein I552_4703 [Mycobacterium xenopi 3993]